MEEDMEREFRAFLVSRGISHPPGLRLVSGHRTRRKDVPEFLHRIREILGGISRTELEDGEIVGAVRGIIEEKFPGRVGRFQGAEVRVTYRFLNENPRTGDPGDGKLTKTFS